MKYIKLLFLLMISNLIFAQESQIIKSNSSRIKIFEGEQLRNWTLESKPKVYATGKNVKSKTIRIITDIDSLSFNIKPNESYDFIVLLNEKDTCFTTIKSPNLVDYSSLKKHKSFKIPFELTDFNNIKIASLLNEKDSLDLIFDTGAYDFSLTREAIKKYLNPNDLKLTFDDISSNSFKIDDLVWENQQIYPIETTGHFSEGMFGWNMFDGKIVEINFDKNIIIVTTKPKKIDKEYEKFDMEYMKYHFCIDIELESKNIIYKSRFLFDSGFQKSIMLDNDLLNKISLPTSNFTILKSSILKNSQNQDIPVNVVNVEKLIFGKYIIENIPTEINSYNKPAGYTTNILGGDIIKRFNIILDFQKNIVYMKPNSNFYKPFFE